MSSRALVIQSLGEHMIAAFVKGDMVDAQNIEAFITALEKMTDVEYELFVVEAEQTDTGVIS